MRTALCVVAVLLFISCQSPLGQLKREYPGQWSDYVQSTMVVYSDTEFGKALNKFELKEDGTIVFYPIENGTVTETFFNLKNPRWEPTSNNANIALKVHWRDKVYIPIHVYTRIEGIKETLENSYLISITNNKDVLGGLPINNNVSSYQSLKDTLQYLVLFRLNKTSKTSIYEVTDIRAYPIARNEHDMADITQKKLKQDKLVAQWKLLKKKSIKDYQTFIKESEGLELQKEVQEQLNKLLDAKIKTYFKSHLPNYYKYCDYELYLVDGSSSDRKFYEIFRLPILAKNPETDMKLDFSLTSDEDGKGFILKYQQANVQLTFLPNDKRQRMILTGLESDYEKHEGMKLSILSGMIFGQMEEYPINNNLDIELLDSLK